MKVTVINKKHQQCLNNAELAGLSVRHNLDLYNNIQVEKFVRRVALKLETVSIAITKAIADITGQLEYSLTQLDKQETRKEKALSKEEHRNRRYPAVVNISKGGYLYIYACPAASGGQQ